LPSSKTTARIDRAGMRPFSRRSGL